MTSILLYNDEPTLTKKLETALRRVEGSQLLPVCGSMAELMERVRHQTADVLLMAVTPEVTFSALADIRHAAAGSKIVLWVNSISIEMASLAMAMGVKGILRKKLPFDLQAVCLQRVQAGELWFERDLGAFSSTRSADLTERENRLLRLLVQGLKDSEIAGLLMVPESAVRASIYRLSRKVAVKDRFELALFGLKKLTGQLAVPDNGRPGAGLGLHPMVPVVS